MKILKEAKDKLPTTFIANFISTGWSTIGLLKDDKEAISKTFSGTKQAEEIIQDLIDAYTIAVARMTNIMNNKDYLDFDENAILEKADKKGLSEDLNININIDNNGDSEPTICPEDIKLNDEPIEITPVVAEPDDDLFIFSEDDFKVDNGPEPQITTTDSYLCDFDDVKPNNAPLTDQDIEDLQRKLGIIK